MRKRYFFKMFIYLLISLLFIEGLFQIISFGTLFRLGYIRIILFSFTTSMIIALICSFFKPKLSKIIILIFTFLVGLYAIIQIGFFNMIGNYMSLNAAGGEGLTRVFGLVKEFISFIKPVYYLTFFPFCILLIIFIFNRDVLTYKKPKFLKVMVRVMIIIIVHLVSLLTLEKGIFQNNGQIKTNKSLYYKPVLLEVSLREFGVVRFFVRDLIYMILPKNDNTGVIINKEPEKEVVTKDPNERKIDDQEWLKLIETEQDSVIKNLHEFYINQDITPKNEMTGKFKDKNMILIMVEAFDMIAINKDITPTLYKLAHEGYYFNNYYTPKYSCTTGESEYIALTSIVPITTVCVPNTYKNNNYETSIFSLFNKSNYYSTSYHNYTDQYYERTTLHQNMGSIKFYNQDDLNIKPIAGWPSDLNLMEEAVPHFINEDKFFSFIITSSTHFPYDDHVGVVVRNWDKVKNLPFHDKIKRYMAKAVELDLALEYLLKALTEKNILDDTVIALFGDHHPLKMETKYLNAASSIDRLVDFNIDRLPFIIYNSELGSKEISKTASTFDILPTIANLFDLDYDPRYYVGKDLFSEEEPIVIFTNGSWITDKAMYFSSTQTNKKLTEDADDAYISEINKKVNDYFYVSDKTLVKDYFKYRFKSSQ